MADYCLPERSLASEIICNLTDALSQQIDNNRQWAFCTNSIIMTTWQRQLTFQLGACWRISSQLSMTSFIFFHVYLILGISSVVRIPLALIKRDYETPGALVVLFLCSLIGLSCNFPGWLRTFCGLYGIVLNG